ncbi:MAG: hypothetical protein Q8936_13025 [Bacillota bacterium]|nr:hypothetical protein [Bacillota bacterium]
MENTNREGLKKCIGRMAEFLSAQAAEIENYDEQIVRWLIDKIMIHGYIVEVEFKSGMSVEVGI